jgi:hypothetical protein
VAAVVRRGTVPALVTCVPGIEADGGRTPSRDARQGSRTCAPREDVAAVLGRAEEDLVAEEARNIEEPRVGDPEPGVADREDEGAHSVLVSAVAVTGHDQSDHLLVGTGQGGREAWLTYLERLRRVLGDPGAFEAKLEERAQAFDILHRIAWTIGPLLSKVIHPRDAQRAEGRSVVPAHTTTGVGRSGTHGISAMVSHDRWRLSIVRRNLSTASRMWGTDRRALSAGRC